MKTLEMAMEPQVRNKGRVLIVDDEAALRRANARILEGAGYAVAEAADGGAAVKAISAQEFDVILSDITMPGMTGVQLLRHVRETDADVPVVLITANPAVDTAVQAVELGALKYMVKPVGQRELLAMVERATKQGRVAKFKRRLAASVSDPAALADRAASEAVLNRGLGTLWMAYQPIVNWRTREIVAYEALLRTAEPDLPNPGALLSIAERLGRIQDVGRKIRAHVAADLREHPRAGDVFVNLHPADLLDEQLYSAQSPLADFARQVVLEITEREALDASADIPVRAARLRKLGYRIAIDDLGAGYSGLDYFARLMPEVAKIDMSLVRGIDREDIKRKLVASLATLCKELGVTVVAEGVETAAERDTVAALGCDWLQGYLFARPGKPYPAVTW
jgi:EAL domain-containing protein (putative c-di-GMP-specific phosphodiesterase class I)